MKSFKHNLGIIYVNRGARKITQINSNKNQTLLIYSETKNNKFQWCGEIKNYMQFARSSVSVHDVPTSKYTISISVESKTRRVCVCDACADTAIRRAALINIQIKYPIFG